MKSLRADEVGIENAEDSLENYLHLNIKMLAGMSVFVGLDGKKDYRILGFPIKIPILSIMTILFAGVDGIYQSFSMISLMATDKKTAILVSTNTLSIISCVTKGFRLSTTVNDVQNVLNDLLKLWDKNRPVGSGRDKIIRKAKKTLFFVKAYMWTTVGLIVDKGVPPIKYMLSQYLIRESLNHTYDYSERIVAIEYPFNINRNSVFYPIMFTEYWILFGLAVFWVCADTLFASLMTHLSLQFEILENDINSYLSYETNERRVKENLITFVNRHREILRVCKEVEKIFSPIIFVNVVVSSMNICVNMYLLQEAFANNVYAGAGFHFFLVINTFLQIIVYCVFAETLTQRTIKISKSIYDSEWTNKNQEFKKCIQILLMNTQHPFYCKAYGFFAMTHEQFTNIVKTAASYYMMLQTTS